MIGAESRNFKAPDEREQPLSFFHREDFVEEDDDWESDDEFFIENDEWKRVKAQIETMNAVTGNDFSADVLRMSAFDIIIGNTDRTGNLSNIGVIEQSDGGHRLIPPFDFGMAFPPKTEHDFLGDEALDSQARSFAAFAREQYGHREPLLEADPAELKRLIDSYRCSLYDDQEVQNVKDQLEANLRRTEGILWRRKS